jgi:hypothetical protein
MKNRGLWLLVAVFALVLVWGLASIYRLRIARGDVFPEYSSLRADPLGARALHDAARLLPGREAERWTRRFSRLEAGRGDTVLVLGLRRNLADDEWAALDRAAIAGASVIVAWRAEPAGPGDGADARALRADPWATEPPKPERKADEKKTEADKQREREERRRRANPEDYAPPRYSADHERKLGYRLSRRELVTRDAEPDARRGEHAPPAWPEELPRWRSDLFFLAREDAGWRVLYRRGGDIVMMSRERGAGRLTLLADSFPLSNEAAHRERPTEMLADLLGDARRVVFVESHLGVETELGVAALARRYGLGGAALTALVLALLWIWRRASPLAPVPPEEPELRINIAPTAGLEALLRRSVPPARLHAACLEAWAAGASPSDRRRVEQMPPAPSADPVAAHRETRRALSKKHLS